MIRILKVGSAFTGIGAWEIALRDENIPFELQWFFEIDKYAEKSYCAIHNEPPYKNMGDITKADCEALKDIDLFVYSPPCQAFSIAGKQLGFNEKRGILFFDALKIIEAKQPKYAIMENVPGLLSAKWKFERFAMLDGLEKAGYNNYMQVLNAKHFDIPQNRERLFIVSIRKDVDDGEFVFPVGKDSGVRLKDVLESNVDEKYYISDEKAAKLLEQIKGNSLPGNDIQKYNPSLNQDGTTTAIDANYYKGFGTRCNKMRALAVEPIIASKKGFIKQSNTNGQYASTLTCGAHTGGNHSQMDLLVEPAILKPERTEYGKQIRKAYEAGEVEESRHNMTTLQPKEDGTANTLTSVQKDNLLMEPVVIEIGSLYGDSMAGRVYDSEGVSPSIRTPSGGNCQPLVLQYRIRRLTPLECWRLMGFSDEDFHAAKCYSESERSVLKMSKKNGETFYSFDGVIEKIVERNSDSQLYKQAGNSIVVDVPRAIYRQLFKLAGCQEKEQMSMF